MKLITERLYASADKRRQRARGQTLCEFLGGRRGVSVLFFVGPRAVAVLKIDSKVLDRLTPNFLADPGKDPVRQVTRKIQCLGKCRCIRRKRLERPNRQLPKTD